MDNIFSENLMPSLGIVVSLFGIIAVHRLLEERNLRQAIRQHVITFKAAFKRQISNSKGIGKFYMGDMATGFSAHESAVQDILPVLPKRYQSKLQKAWNEYAGKGNGLEYEPEDYVRTMWACIESGKPDVSDNIEKKFHNLFTCLDDFL